MKAEHRKFAVPLFRLKIERIYLTFYSIVELTLYFVSVKLVKIKKPSKKPFGYNFFSAGCIPELIFYACNFVKVSTNEC